MAAAKDRAADCSSWMKEDNGKDDIDDACMPDELMLALGMDEVFAEEDEEVHEDDEATGNQVPLKEVEEGKGKPGVLLSGLLQASWTSNKFVVAHTFACVIADVACKVL